MSVFSKISDVLLLVVYSVISVARGSNSNGSAYNCSEIYIVCFSLICIDILIGITCILFFLLLKLECIQALQCCNWLPQGIVQQELCPFWPPWITLGSVSFGDAGEYSSLQLAYLHSSLPPSPN